MLSELCTHQEKINNFRGDIKNAFITELDKRDIGGGMHHASKILEKIESRHTRILDGLEKIGIDSNSDKNENQDELQNMLGADADIEPGRSRNMLHCYNGGLHILPQGWKRTDMTFVQYITMWLCGDRAKGIPPLRLLQTTHLKQHIPRANHVLCVMRYLKKAVERQAIQVGK